MNALDYLSLEQGKNELAQFVYQDSRALLQAENNLGQLKARLSVVELYATNSANTAAKNSVAVLQGKIASAEIDVAEKTAVLTSSVAKYETAFPDSPLQISLGAPPQG